MTWTFELTNGNVWNKQIWDRVCNEVKLTTPVTNITIDVLKSLQRHPIYGTDVSMQLLQKLKTKASITFDPNLLQARIDIHDLQSKAERDRTLLPKHKISNEKDTSFEVPIGTRLWHASHDETFDTENIILGNLHKPSEYHPRSQKMGRMGGRDYHQGGFINDSFIYLTSDKHLAIQSIGGCSNSLYHPYMYNSYIHEFLVVKEIPNLKVVDQNELTRKNKLIEYRAKYCTNTRGTDGHLNNGFLYFINRQDFSKLTGQFIDGQAKEEYAQPGIVQPREQNNIHHAVIEVGLCNPSSYLSYIGTYRCDAPRRLSKKYSFTEGKSNYSAFVETQNIAQHVATSAAATAAAATSAAATARGIT